MPKNRNGRWYIRFEFGKREILMVTEAVSKTEARRLEVLVKHALRSKDFTGLNHEARLITIRLFENRGWDLPDTLRPGVGSDNNLPAIQDEITLWKAVELCLKYPEIANSRNKSRLKNCFIHLVEKFGQNKLVKEIRIPQIKQYRIERLNEGAAPATVNKEKGALSRIFQVLIEMELVDQNPARSVPNLSEKSGLREVYVSFRDFQIICEGLPVWYRPVAQVAYYTGMRRGEIYGLRRSQVDLAGRLIYLSAEDTKEKHRKRVPIHRDLVPVIETVMKIQAIGNDMLFLRHGEAYSKGEGRRSWEQASRQAGLKSLRFHDLRHTWKTNARRSGMDPEIREAILGHSSRMRSTSERYGYISDEELVKAIDLLTFDHGGTKIWTAKAR